MALGYKPDEERVFLDDGEELVSAPDEPEPKASRSRSRVAPVTACASARGEWAWMAIDVCVSRHGGGLPKGSGVVSGPEGVVDFLRKTVPAIVNGMQEHLLVVPVSTRNQILGVSVVAKGERAAVGAQPADLFAPCFMLPATGMILVHNHPSDSAQPSDADREFTKRVKEAAKILGIRLLDHFIVTPSSYYSFSEHGAM